MTLLAPTAMLWAALLAVPPLALLYLLKLRRKPMRVTSTMLWDQAARDLEVNVPFRWIRPSWLLALHALILAALLIAIGRPALPDGGGASGRVFLLIDRSASMNAPADPSNPGGPTRLERARERAIRTIDDLADSASPPEVTVIAFAAQPIVMGPPALDGGTIRAMIDAVMPTDQPGDPEAALTLVRSLTTQTSRAAPDEADDTQTQALAVLFTDGVDRGGRRTTAGNTPLRTEIIGAADGVLPRNVALVGFAADREIDSPAFVRVFARLLSTATTNASVPLIVRLDGEPIARRAVIIPPASPARPGERAESFRLAIPEGGVLSLSIDRADAYAADNSAFAVLPPVRRPAVLVVTPDAPGSDRLARERIDPILLDVLDAIGTAGVRVVDRRRYTANAAGFANEYGLVVFDRVRPVEMPPIPSLSFGAPLADGPAGGARFVRAAEAGRTPVLAWDRDHPVMRDAVLDTIFVGDRLIFPEDDDAPAAASAINEPAGPTRTTLARGATGPLILALDDGGVRRIATAFSLDQTNWPVHFSFPIFVLSAFDYLVPNADTGWWHETGDEITIEPPASAATALRDTPTDISIEGPTTKTVRWNPTRGGRRVPIGFLE